MASEPLAQGEEVKKKDPSAKEQFIFTDPEGQLYNLTVECNAIRNVSKLSPESGLGSITCITWKSDFIIRGDSEGNIHCMDVRKTVSKIHSTNRGLIKKIRFAPGRGNNKLFVLHIECVSLWDLSNNEFDFIGELRSQRDTVKILDIEWAASDRPVISTADGCIKILTENLQSSTSPVDVYRLKTFSPSLLPNSSKRADFKVSIHHQPWKTKFSFHYSDSLKIQFDLLDPDLKKGLLNSNSQLERSYLASCESSVCLGESLWERDFWTVANAVLNDPLNDLTSLDINYDIMSNHFVDYSSKRLKFHLTKTIDKSKKRNTVDTLLCLVENPDDVVRTLLEIDPSDPSYYVDNLKACLVLSLKDSFSTSTQSTIKLVATNLISEGKIWEGVNLLCLIGKVFDACKYLQSYNEWEASLWLGKSRLEYDEFKQLALKYCDHCLTNHRRRRALLMYMKLKEYVMVLDVLYSGKMIPLAAKFLQVLEERECLPDSSHALVLTEEISLAYARYLFDIKNIDAAYYYCDKADEKGEILRREFDVLLSKNT